MEKAALDRTQSGPSVRLDRLAQTLPVGDHLAILGHFEA